MRNKKLQLFAAALRQIPQGKPVITVSNVPYAGSITMTENGDGSWAVATGDAEDIVADVTPPDAYGLLYPLFARIYTKEV